MLSSDSEPGGWAVDTSVAVGYLHAGHSAHRACVAALNGRTVGLSGHAAFETYSVLTRLPESSRIAANDARRAIEAAFPRPCWLPPAAHDDLLGRLAELGITGGAVYDALVGEAARIGGRRLLTRDRRARLIYDLIGVSYEFIG